MILVRRKRKGLALVGFAQGNPPTPPNHLAGHLFVGNLSRTGTTAGTPDAAEGWSAWGSAYSGNSHSSVFGSKVADSAAEVWGDWLQAGRRTLYVFSGAALDTHNGSTSASGTSLTWPALTIAANSFVGAILVCQTAQTALSMAVEGPDGVTDERFADGAGTPPTLIADTGANRLSTWSPGSARTLDTATTHVQSVFSIKAA